jgi:hypothetical protein
LPQRFQLVNGKTSQTAGVALLPLLGASAVGKQLHPNRALKTSKLTKRLASGVSGWLSSGEGNRSFYSLTGSSAFMVLGSGLLSVVGYGATIPHDLYGYEVLLGFGLGGALVSSILMIKLNASEEDAGRFSPSTSLKSDLGQTRAPHANNVIASAQGLQSQARILGGNIGLALATIILNSHLTSDLAGMLTPQQINDVRRSLNAIETFTPREIAAVAESFARAFKTQLQACAGVSAACFVVCFLAWQRHPPSFVDWEKKKVGSRGQPSEDSTEV